MTATATATATTTRATSSVGRMDYTDSPCITPADEVTRDALYDGDDSPQRVSPARNAPTRAKTLQDSTSFGDDGGGEYDASAAHDGGGVDDMDDALVTDASRGSRVIARVHDETADGETRSCVAFERGYWREVRGESASADVACARVCAEAYHAYFKFVVSRALWDEVIATENQRGAESGVPPPPPPVSNRSSAMHFIRWADTPREYAALHPEVCVAGFTFPVIASDEHDRQEQRSSTTPPPTSRQDQSAAAVAGLNQIKIPEAALRAAMGNAEFTYYYMVGFDADTLEAHMIGGITATAFAACARLRPAGSVATLGDEPERESSYVIPFHALRQRDPYDHRTWSAGSSANSNSASGAAMARSEECAHAARAFRLWEPTFAAGRTMRADGSRPMRSALHADGDVCVADAENAVARRASLLCALHRNATDRAAGRITSAMWCRNVSLLLDQHRDASLLVATRGVVEAGNRPGDGVEQRVWQLTCDALDADDRVRGDASLLRAHVKHVEHCARDLAARNERCTGAGGVCADRQSLPPCVRACTDALERVVRLCEELRRELASAAPRAAFKRYCKAVYAVRVDAWRRTAPCRLRQHTAARSTPADVAADHARCAELRARQFEDDAALVTQMNASACVRMHLLPRRLIAAHFACHVNEADDPGLCDWFVEQEAALLTYQLTYEMGTQEACEQIMRRVIDEQHVQAPSLQPSSLRVETVESMGEELARACERMHMERYGGGVAYDPPRAWYSAPVFPLCGALLAAHDALVLDGRCYFAYTHALRVVLPEMLRVNLRDVVRSAQQLDHAQNDAMRYAVVDGIRALRSARAEAVANGASRRGGVISAAPIPDIEDAHRFSALCVVQQRGLLDESRGASASGDVALHYWDRFALSGAYLAAGYTEADVLRTMRARMVRAGDQNDARVFKQKYANIVANRRTPRKSDPTQFDVKTQSCATLASSTYAQRNVNGSGCPYAQMDEARLAELLRRSGLTDNDAVSRVINTAKTPGYANGDASLFAPDPVGSGGNNSPTRGTDAEAGRVLRATRACALHLTMVHPLADVRTALNVDTGEQGLWRPRFPVDYFRRANRARSRAPAQHHVKAESSPL